MTKNRIIMKGILAEINDIISFIRQDNCKDVNDFITNKKLQKAVMMSLINIAEKVKELPSEFKEKHPQIQWHIFKSIRNIAAHKYGAINFVLVWQIVSYVPEMQIKIKNITEL